MNEQYEQQTGFQNWPRNTQYDKLITYDYYAIFLNPENFGKLIFPHELWHKEIKQCVADLILRYKKEALRCDR